MFIILTNVYDGKIRVNVKKIVYYFRVKYEGEKECTELRTVNSLEWVTETPEDIDTLIIQALEQKKVR